MERVKITANYRLLRVFYGIFSLSGAAIIGGYLYNYMAGEMMEGRFSSIVVGLIAFIGGGGLAVGLFRPALPEIVIDGDQMCWGRPGWNSSFKWNKLKKVSLEKKSIRVQFAQSGAYDTLGIPYLVRIGNMKTLRDALEKECVKNGVEFTDKLSFNI